MTDGVRHQLAEHQHGVVDLCALHPWSFDRNPAQAAVISPVAATRISTRPIITMGNDAAEPVRASLRRYAPEP